MFLNIYSIFVRRFVLQLHGLRKCVDIPAYFALFVGLSKMLHNQYQKCFVAEKKFPYRISAPRMYMYCVCYFRVSEICIPT